MSTSIIPRSVQQRVTATLFISQSLFSASTILSFTLLPIISAHLSGADRAAGVPPTMMMLGRAVAAYPVGWLMDHIGRRPGLSLGYLFATVGSALSVLSISRWESFPWLCAGVLLIGMGRGVSEQARFIAAEAYPPVRRASVIGLIVFAGTIGAVGGAATGISFDIVSGVLRLARPRWTLPDIGSTCCSGSDADPFPTISRSHEGWEDARERLEWGGEEKHRAQVAPNLCRQDSKAWCGGDDNRPVCYDVNYGNYTAAHESSRPWSTGDFVGDNGAYTGDVRAFEPNEPPD